MDEKKVSVIVLNYNGKNFLEICLPSIKKQTYKNIEILVADNNSSDNSCQYIKENFPEVKIIKNSDNFGYAKANNIAANEAIGDFLLFLNNDTELFSDMIEKLVKVYKKKSILAPAQILSVNKETDKIGAAGNGMDIFGYPYVNKNPKKTRVFYVDGAAIFVERTDFFTIGMFDDELFIFQEDIDFSWRAKLLGYEIIQCWDAKFYHYSGGAVLGGGFKNKQYETSYFRRYLNEKNIIRNILKNYSFFFCVGILLIIITIHFFEIIVLIITGNWKAAACYLRAYKWNFINIDNTLKFRKKVQENRVISDFKVFSKVYFAYSKLTSFIRIGFPKFK
jgi:GT2 family glycosyltransferase